jgi:hypothetical protein
MGSEISVYQGLQFVLCQKQADTKYRLKTEFRQLLCNKFCPKWHVNATALLNLKPELSALYSVGLFVMFYEM